ncbi:MAG: Uma2 family endonuclease [Chroococcidiopsidaceae cyanobacterium CP_BM_RX_35]|nr:Uma2 family endonuclease [Chroococcidiopsidaceae cyanobacterium CP_BM_RX_35]
MVRSPTELLTLDEFLVLPEGNTAYELVDGQAVPKMSPKFFHSSAQKNLLLILERWSYERGRVEPEWAVTLKQNGNDWVPVPDLLYISYNHLAAEWMEDAPCPVAPELAIEIISPGQSFGEMTEKATDYLMAGVLRVWVVDTKAQSITVFAPDALPKTYRGSIAIADPLLPDLNLTALQVFQKTSQIV